MVRTGLLAQTVLDLRTDPFTHGRLKSHFGDVSAGLWYIKHGCDHSTYFINAQCITDPYSKFSNSNSTSGFSISSIYRSLLSQLAVRSSSLSATFIYLFSIASIRSRHCLHMNHQTGAIIHSSTLFTSLVIDEDSTKKNSLRHFRVRFAFEPKKKPNLTAPNGSRRFGPGFVDSGRTGPRFGSRFLLNPR
ncbi:hypothetical protein DFJ58DRAFT_227791 [Suillus subalutaceus]|uniref:uncharacterized protein n=1 Tax=Suillus subalutaceus TaxID=48586 RepID=UPI001B860BAC|nr:uncharacterized protein DFJ58DRAFT_227791 [Suillus subalutaceus]KAG1862839.1 hypothetical protein DFJ58DRAFT_227791 [Suillus subalutaceus]